MPNPSMPADNRLSLPILDHVATLPPAWAAALSEPAAARALADVAAYVDQRVAQGAVVYPATPFRALQDLAPADVRVVILGQDPYHGPGQAQGLAFSVPDDCKRPPSLRNIFKEINAEYPGPGLDSGLDSGLASSVGTGNDLTPWVRQGVLLLNTSLTVEQGQPASHARRGWETVTDALIALVAREPHPKVFMLWGAHAQTKQVLLPGHSGHLVLMSNHPSPLSAGRPPVPFLGNGHFRLANEWLEKQGLAPVNWALPHKPLA